MVKILTVIQNKKEAEILELAFKQKAFRVINTEPGHALFIKCLQFSPDILIIEVTLPAVESLSLIKLLHDNRRTTKIPIIAFGSITEPALVRDIESSGVSRYHQRPLKFGQLMTDIQYFLKDKGAAVAPPAEEKAGKRAEDFQILLNKDKKPSEKLEIMADHVGKLMAFPFTVSRILKITQDQKTGAEELSMAIRADASVTATILKVSNSVLFASRDRTISDIKDAVVRLGFNETKNIALCMSVMKAVDPSPKSMGYDRMEFWFHSLAAGVIAESLARKSGFPNPEEAFLAGLLHDFGILLLDEFFSEIFEKIMEKAAGGPASFGGAVNDLLGIHHNELVDRLFEKWKIPSSITDGILRSPRYQDLEPGARPEQILLPRVVGVANVVAKAAGLGRECDEWVGPVSNSLLKDLKQPGGFTPGFFEDVRRQIDLYAKFMKLETSKPANSEGTDLRLALVNHSPALFEPHLHYLMTQGFPLSVHKSAAELEGADTTPDVIVVNRGSLKPPEETRPFLKIPKKKPGFKQNPDQPAFVPVLYFGENEEEEKGLPKEFAAVKTLRKSLDLREIELALGQVSGAAPAP